jgi:hypothetical protein
LIEEQRTNFNLSSDAFDSLDWDTLNVTITANSQAGPFGTGDADTLTENTIDNRHDVRPDIFPALIAGDYVQSYYLKPNGRTRVQLIRLSADIPDGPVFDLVSGDIVGSNTAESAIKFLSDGWVRIWLKFNLAADGPGGYVPRLILNTVTDSYQGDGTSGVYLWQAQLEEGTVPSTPIITAGTQVTRAADNCVRTLGDEFNPKQWALYLEADLAQDPGEFQFVLNFQGGGSTASSGVQISNSSLRVRADDGTVYLQVNADNQGLHKYAIAFDGTRYILVRDGVSTGWAAGDPISLTTIGLPFSLATGTVDTTGVFYKDLRLFPTALSEAELITLTGG